MCIRDRPLAGRGIDDSPDDAARSSRRLWSRLLRAQCGDRSDMRHACEYESATYETSPHREPEIRHGCVHFTRREKVSRRPLDHHALVVTLPQVRLGSVSYTHLTLPTSDLV